MATGFGIIREGLSHSLNILSDGIKGLLIGLATGRERTLLVRVDGEAHLLIEEVAEHNDQPVEVVASDWLTLQAQAYKQARQIKQGWLALTHREKQVVALSCLGYSDREIAETLDIAYGTARTHLYNAIHKFGIRQKSELHFLLRKWDFSDFDRDFSQ